jgi:hypothetical protein
MMPYPAVDGLRKDRMEWAASPLKTACPGSVANRRSTILAAERIPTVPKRAINNGFLGGT